MDHLEWRDAHIVGYSMGGVISLELASAAPERVKSLSLLATTRGKYTSGKDDGTALRMLFTREPAALVEFMVGILYPKTFKSRKMDDSDEIVHHQLIAFHRHHFENAAPLRFIRWIGRLLALVTHFVSDERLTTIAQAGFPVLIIGCGDDDLIPRRESATLATHIKGTHVKYTSYDDAGHGVTVQYMDEVTEELLATSDVRRPSWVLLPYNQYTEP